MQRRNDRCNDRPMAALHFLPPTGHSHRFAARAPCDSKGSECQCGIHTAEAASALRSRKTERAAKEKPTPISHFFLAPAAPRSDPVRFHPCLFHSSSKYSPKSQVAVKKTTSKATKKASQVRGSSGGSASSPEVASALAIKTGVSTGKRSRGTSTSRMRACEATAENTVPTVVNPSVPRISTNITGNKRPCTGVSRTS